MILKKRAAENIRTGLSPAAIEQDVLDNLNLIQGRVPATATLNDWYLALAYTVRDRVLERWMHTIDSYMTSPKKALCYFSAEFLIGPQLLAHMVNLGIVKEVQDAMQNLGQDLEQLIRQEHEPGLGNGGLGRLAACYLDSLASLDILAVGYGIRYEFGIFKQTIRDGWQVEVADHWLRLGNPWELSRPEIAFKVHFNGSLENTVWKPARTIRGVACDFPVTGYHRDTVNLLRLWKADAEESFDFQAFNAGEYWRSVEEKVHSENITKVLYPNDVALEGKRLRLIQQYFFVSCSLQDMMRVHKMRGNRFEDFHQNFAVQLNDTHPAIAIAELMRLLLDEQGMPWDLAWHITQQTFAYTNHTLLPEALEKWSLPLFESLLPRHLQIIYEINHRFLNQARELGFNDEMLRKLSIIEEEGEKSVRMANLACIGSHAVNGVSKLHSELLTAETLHHFFQIEPQKFFNITNGITPRRWIIDSNPRLADLISAYIGTSWINHAESELHKLESFIKNESFCSAWKEIKQANKQRLACLIEQTTGIEVDPQSLFDIQVKRIHEYKRQHLNILHVIYRYVCLKNQPELPCIPRTVIFGGKAAPGYHVAKLMIKLIHNVAAIINNDPAIAGRLKVVFLPDFNVKNGQWIYPAADLSEQISTAGKEASGTGNMKFALNGALTIGTLDGANVEILEAVGPDNFFLFGLTAPEIAKLEKEGYHPQVYMQKDASLGHIIDLLKHNYFSPNAAQLFKPLVDELIYTDRYKLMADFNSYIKCQGLVDQAYSDQASWMQKSMLNCVRCGKFSSDRAIREYAHLIWSLSA